MEPADVINQLGRTAFAYGVDCSRLDILHRLLAYNPDAEFWSEQQPHVWHPLRICLQRLNPRSLSVLLEHGADPNDGLLHEWHTFRTLPTPEQINHHRRYRLNHTPLNFAVQGHVNTLDRASRLNMINCLLYYGADCNIPGLYYTPLHALFENFGSIKEDIIPSVKMMLFGGLDIHSEQWLIDRLHPGVPLGSPQLRQWLLENATSPRSLKNSCLTFFRKYLNIGVVKKVPLLPLPQIITDFLLLKDHFQLPVISAV